MAPAAPAVRVAVALTAVALALILLPRGLVGTRLRIDVDPPTTGAAVPIVRDLTPYEGLGTWIDAYDYGPAYQTEGHAPAVTPDDVDTMADAGVRTLFIQANREDERSPDGFVDRDLLTRFLVRAHERDMAVVGWYLPTFASVTADLGHLRDLIGFESEGQRLDGVGVDIEFTEAVPNPAVRSQRLIRLSERLADVADGTPLGAIVLPPVLTEVVNPDFWPGFPWAEIEPSYDVWLPMSYWTQRTEDSGYRDGATYHDENIRRMRADLGREDIVVHGIGGIADETTGEDLLEFAQTLSATGAVGGSVYDWATLSQGDILLLGRLFDDYPDVH